MANSEAKNTVKHGKKRQKDKWYPFHACTGGGVVICGLGFPGKSKDDRQIAHLIGVHLNICYMTFWGCFGPPSCCFLI